MKSVTLVTSILDLSTSTAGCDIINGINLFIRSFFNTSSETAITSAFTLCLTSSASASLIFLCITSSNTLSPTNDAPFSGTSPGKIKPPSPKIILLTAFEASATEINWELGYSLL